MISHVVRRGLEHPSTIQTIKRAVEEGPRIEMPTWGSAIIFVTFVVSVVFLSAVEYTLKEVVATLCMVETPSAAITVSAAADEPATKDQKEPLLETGPTITVVNAKPITSSIRGTIRHVVSHAGRFARWRGFKISLLYGLVFSVALNVFSAIVPRVPGHMVLISALAGAACANIHASWTHKVVSMPTQASFWSRVPSRSYWKTLAAPAAAKAAMPYLALYITHGFILLLGLHRNAQDNFADYSGAQWASLILRSLSALAIGVLCAIFLCLPAVVTLIRVEASILPEENDTIVPFDRTFAGKVVPRILGGSGAIGFFDAWRSFNWEARRRLIKLYLKIFFVMTALFLVAAHVLAFEVFAIMGPALGKYLKEVQEKGAFVQ
ncbi:hypothetical protein BS50DRAFT_483166 [Corynespora cassiicola Philippines]|uniref:Ubiquitin carrier protein n=1 Tax=Corynespora cassiicola Philippines TaxID=1448308 RepID=A0A2T2P7A9_CORCC|nr:hypothetical protein BS50DRAFT_483166 [Corynespora cassiicola Philippines]